MNYKLFFIFLSFMLLFFSTAYAEFTQKSDALGLVIMQAEAYDSIRAGLGSKTGETFSLEDSIAGYIGDGYMQANMAAGDGNASHADTIGIKLTYVVNFVNTGPQYVWARAYYRDGQSDSFFWGSDSATNGQCARGSDWRYGAWYWYRADSSVVLDAPGTHTINFYGREPDARLDMIIVTSSNTFNPNTDLKEIAFVSLPGKDNPDTPEEADADKPFIDDLIAEGYVVNTVYSSSLETASQDLLDELNNADLVIIGRSGSSSDFGGTHKAAWNNISAPVLNLHLWTARTSRLNWLPTGTTTSYDTGGDTISAKIELPDDPVFADATLAADSTMDWVATPYDYMGTTDGGNGTVLARDAVSSNVFFVRWDPWIRFYDGASDFAAGYRTLIGNGNDHASATTGGAFNYYNFTEEAKQVYLNEVARMVELPEPPEKPVGLGKEIVFVSLPGKDNPDTPEEADADKPFIDDLLALEYTVTTVYSAALSTASEGLVDTLNNADLVIIGRSGSSGDFGDARKADKEAWNAISAPLLNLHLYTARTSRLNWLNTNSAAHNDAVGDTIIAKIELPDDPVFAGATIAAADSTMDWVITPSDYIVATDGGNGTVLARDANDSNVFFVRWDPWVRFYDGAGDFAAGYRTLIGNGNDHTTPFNYYNFTAEAKQVYLNEVARMVELPEPPEKPVGLGKEIVFVSLPGKDNPDTPEEADADKPFIDDLLALEYTVTMVYSAALSTASEGLVDTLNNADLVIIGRSGSSGDFGNNLAADREAWNAIRSPLLNLHLYTVRTSRLNWLNSNSAEHNDAVGDTIIAKIELPDDPVFAGATIAAADSTMDWVITPSDYIVATDGGNGTVLARDAVSSNVFFVRWEPTVEFYEGAGDIAGGHRTLIGNGNDHTTPFNYYNFTDEAKQVYLNEVARMVELPKGPVGIEGEDYSIVPTVYALGQNYPNPFNPVTNIKFSLPKAGRTTLKIYNTLGQLVSTIVDKDMNAGVHTVLFRATSISSGVYFYRIESGDFIKVKKMVLLK
jgi:fructose-specific component phosphotransferase system IIB-like protein